MSKNDASPFAAHIGRRSPFLTESKMISLCEPHYRHIFGANKGLDLVRPILKYSVYGPCFNPLGLDNLSFLKVFKDRIV